MITTLLGDNVENMHVFFSAGKRRPNCIYADCIYEDGDFKEWLIMCIDILADSGILYVQTDYHTVAEINIVLDRYLDFVNWIIYKQEWGGRSTRFFPRKHDDILMYSKGKDYKFYPERIMIPKATAGTALDKRGDGLKIPCDVFDDLGNFSTISKERVKIDGKNVQWQKPLKLLNRLLLPVTDEGDLVLDPFMGTGTTAVWCRDNHRDFVGIENDEKIYKVAMERLGL